MSEYKLNKYLAKLENTSSSLKKELYTHKLNYYKNKNMKGGNLQELSNSLKQNYTSIFNGLDELSHITKQTINMSKNYNNVVRAVMFGNNILEDIRNKLNGPVKQSIYNKDMQIKSSLQKGGNNDDQFAEVNTDINELFESLTENQKQIDATKKQIEELITEIIDLINALETCRKALQECNDTNNRKLPHKIPTSLNPLDETEDSNTDNTEDSKLNLRNRIAALSAARRKTKAKPQVKLETLPTGKANNVLSENDPDDLEELEKIRKRKPSSIADTEPDSGVPDEPKCTPEHVEKQVFKLLVTMGKRNIVGTKLNECENRYARLVAHVKTNLERIKQLAANNVTNSTSINNSLGNLVSILRELKNNTNNYLMLDCNGKPTSNDETVKFVGDEKFTNSIKEATSKLRNFEFNGWTDPSIDVTRQINPEVFTYEPADFAQLINKLRNDEELKNIPNINKILDKVLEQRKTEYDELINNAKTKYTWYDRKLSQ